MAALNNAVIPDTISLTLPPNPALLPGAAALEHKGQDRLTPLGRQADLSIAALFLAGFSQRSFPANRHGAAPRTAKMASDHRQRWRGLATALTCYPALRRIT